MIDIRHLIEFLPFHFKSKDTYKVNGKGILERFLEICGDYFTDKIKLNIDNSLDVINIDTTSSQYLAWIWELLGQIPFANSVGTKPLRITEQQQRDLIRYCNELLKIRGSKEFFEIMFRIYSNDTNQLQLVSIESEDFGWDQDIRDSRTYIKKVTEVNPDGTFTEKYEEQEEDKNIIWPYFDVESLDNIKNIAFDKYYRMKQCIKVTFTITGQFNESEISSAQKAIRAFIERFVPYNVHPIVKVNGVTITDKYNLVLEILTNDGWKEAPDDTVTLSSGQILKARVYAVDEFGKTVEGVSIISNLNGGPILDRTSVYEFEVSNVIGTEDVYKFTLDGDPDDKTKTLKVEKATENDVTYHISIDPTYGQLSDKVREGTCIVTAYSQIQGSPEVGASVMCIETGEVKTPETGEVTTNWEFTIPGTYTFIMIGHTASRVTYELKDWVRNYEVRLAQAVYNEDSKQWEAPSEDEYTGELTLTGTQINNLKFFVRVTSNDSKVSQEDLKCYILGDHTKQYQTGTMLTPTGFGTYTFVPSNAKDGDGSANARLVVINNDIRFNTYISDREANPSVIDDDTADTWAKIKADPQTEAATRLITRGRLKMVVQLPVPISLSDGTTTDKIEITSGQTKSKEGYYTITMGYGNSITIRSELGGTYTVWASNDPSSKATWSVIDNRSRVQVPSLLVVVPERINDTAWSGAYTSHAIYSPSSETEVEVRYALYLIDDEGKTVFSNYRVTEVETGDTYILGKTIYKPNHKSIFNYKILLGEVPEGGEGEVHPEELTAVVQINALAIKVNLNCTPSRALINNGQATTKISITANSSKVTLQAKLEGTDDLYSNGDIFLANEAKEYIFVAMVDGKQAVDGEDNPVTCSFQVIDPSQVVVTPDTIVFEADGSASDTGDTLQITTGDNTEWNLVLQ